MPEGWRVSETTDDRLLDGRVVVRQPVNGYRAAIDPILLAAAVRAKPGQKILDAGCGTGAAMFCLAARIPGLALTGLEIQQAHAVLAGEGIALNKLAETFIAVGDITRPPPDMLGTFDVVLTNPPYGDDGTPPPEASLAVAHMEGETDVAAWMKGCLSCLKARGRLVLIHRADRLSDILAALHTYKCGDIRILPIFPKTGAPARRVIVDAGKERRSPDTLLPGLVLHEEGGAYTPAAEKVLRHAHALVAA
jgi:tRNA1(Val) A37 N6-methylase TrmN6